VSSTKSFEATCKPLVWWPVEARSVASLVAVSGFPLRIHACDGMVEDNRRQKARILAAKAW